MPVCNGPDMPTSICSFLVRNSMEPFLLRKANDDRRLSIAASQTRHKDCRASRPLISMAKAGTRHAAIFAASLLNRDITGKRCPSKDFSRVRGNSHARF